MSVEAWSERYRRLPREYDGWRIGTVRARGYREMDLTRTERLLELIDKVAQGDVPAALTYFPVYLFSIIRIRRRKERLGPTR